MEAEIEALIKAGYYSSKSEVVKDALRLLFESRKELKVASTIELYKGGEISLGKAAEIAGVTVLKFKELLASRGIYRELVAESTREMDEKLKKLSDQMIIKEFEEKDNTRIRNVERIFEK